MTKLTAFGSKSLTSNQLIETRKLALGMRLSLYATILGVIAALFPLLHMIVSSLPFLQDSQAPFLPWLTVLMMWGYAGAAIVGVLASVFIIGAPGQIKVFRIGLIYTICTLFASTLAGMKLMGGVGVGGAVGVIFGIAHYPAWLLCVDRVAKFTEAGKVRKDVISAMGLLCLGLICWLSVQFQQVLMQRISDWAVFLAEWFEGSMFPSLLQLSGNYYLAALGVVTVSISVSSLLVSAWGVKRSRGTRRQCFIYLLIAAVLFSLAMFSGIFFARSNPVPMVKFYAATVRTCLMIVAIVPLFLSPLKAYRGGLFALQSLDELLVTQAQKATLAATGYSARQPFYKRSPMVTGLIAVLFSAVVVFAINKTSWLAEQGDASASVPSDQGLPGAIASHDRPGIKPLKRTRPLILGMPAPELGLSQVVHGEQIKAYKDSRLHVILFWATWCDPCLEVIPRLSELTNKYGEEVTFLAVTKESPDRVLQFLQSESTERGVTWSEKIGYSIAIDRNDSMHETYLRDTGVASIPFAFVIGVSRELKWAGHPLGIESVLEEIINAQSAELESTNGGSSG